MSGEGRCACLPELTEMTADQDNGQDTPPSDRCDALRDAISAAMSLLAEAPPGESATLHVCRGAPLCDAMRQPPGFNAACAMCECITVSEHGVIGYPLAGTA